ncbi:aromatic ring-hydroxylating dioxygenase subunit alpha [Iodidimonas sp. SYSU 1G8]|uniref:aromatic ring-hydroxylating oxygenase subunit alpha n=1 Tax=Iodidimonas sp. SYSU 1G8 TaxID=3133967 RepID=UPI0031FE48BD
MPQTNTYIDFGAGSLAVPSKRATLDAFRYTSHAFMMQEWNAIWTRTWLLAGLALDVAEPGDYFVFDIGAESIIVSRAENGTVAAFYNACQHRGNRIVTAERGAAAAITCPYHGWTYHLDGTLKLVPDEERFSQGLPVERLSLKPVKAEVWAGLVWINMDPDAAPLGDFLGLVQGQLAPYRFEDMVLVKDQTVALDANWKTCVDNFNEQYHVDFIHPQHASFVDCRDAANELWPFGHRRVLVEGYVTNPRYGVPEELPSLLQAAIRPLGLDAEDFRGKVPTLRKAVQQRKREVGRELGFDYSGFTDDQVSDVLQYDLFPNIIMTIKPEELWVMRPRPHPTDPDKCFFDKWTLRIHVPADAGRGLSLVGDPNAAPLDSSERPEHEVFTREDVIAGRHSMTITIDQDIHYLKDMQAGMHSRGFTRAWLNEDEARVQHFHDWVDVWLEQNPLRPEARLSRAAE